MYIYSAYAHPVGSVKQMCTLMFTTSVCCTHLHMHGAHNTSECMHTLRKNVMGSCMRAYATVHQLLCHGSYCKLIWRLARASCRLSFAARSCRPFCCLEQTRLPCRPHPVCLWFTLAHDRGSHPRRKSIFAAIFAGFSYNEVTP